MGNGFVDEGPVTAGGGAGIPIGGVVGPILNVAAGLYDSYQNRKTSKENTERTIAAQKAESELAYQRSVEMWNMQNLYNSPSAQMDRFKAAGLNPHLIYGQGSSGNASGFPQYQPANLQYRYEAPTYGAAIASLLPTLMSVGQWMQNMRKSEVDIQKAKTDTTKVQQVIDYLTYANPRLLEALDNKLSLFPYQYDIQKHAASAAYTKLGALEQDFRHQYGEELFNYVGTNRLSGKTPDIGGVKRLKFLQEKGKLESLGYQNKLLEAKSSWTDFDITDPQAIMQMVMQGVFNMAGQTLRLSTHKSKKYNHEVEERMRSGRVRIRRRSYEH
ncbi:DNA pilot protein [Apis mellifera associated microvirus 35]|nr:DNA pilot protein [Apis mellifera associated microvirus 35]